MKGSLIMKKIKCIKKIFQKFIVILLGCFVVGCQPIILVKADEPELVIKNTFYYETKGRLIYIDNNITIDDIGEYLGGYWSNQLEYEIMFKGKYYNNGLSEEVYIPLEQLYYDNYWKIGIEANGVTNFYRIQAPCMFVFYNYHLVSHNDSMTQLFENWRVYEDLIHINGVVNFKNKLDLHTNGQFLYNEAIFREYSENINYIWAYWPIMTKTEYKASNVIYSGRNTTYKVGTEQYDAVMTNNIDTIIGLDANGTHNDYSLYTKYRNKTILWRAHEKTNNNTFDWENSQKNNYIMFGDNYIPSNAFNWLIAENYTEERSEETLTEIFYTIFDVIFQYIYNMLDFSILGVNIFELLLGIISILLLVKVLKMFL